MARAIGSSVRFTTNCPVRWMLFQVSLRRPSGRLLMANITSGGSSAKTLKKAVSHQIRHADRAGEVGEAGFLTEQGPHHSGLPCNCRSQPGATPGMR